MEKMAALFGKEFKLARQALKISQWKVVHKTGDYLANIQRIEKGLTQPGVPTAFRLLEALGLLPGDFLADLAAKYVDSLPVSISPLPQAEIFYDLPQFSENPKSLFGPFLQRARAAACISQTAMAKAASYNLRNINAVEKGLQTPGIMTALALVLSTGVNVREFFNRLYFTWLETDPETGGK